MKFKWQISWYLLILAAVVFISFSPCLKNGFVYWDEDYYLLNNPAIRDFSPSAVIHLFVHPTTGIYIPLTLCSFAVEYHFFHFNPFVYHLDNVLLHVACCLLVFWFIWLLCNDAATAFLTAALFSLSPLRVESVAWVMERKDVLYSFFYVFSLITYLYYIDKKQWKYFFVTTLLFICSLLAKPQAIALPLTLLLIDCYKQRPWKEIFLEKMPFLLLGAVFLWLSLEGVSHLPLVEQKGRIGLACYTLLLFLIKSFVPIHLSAIYPIPRPGIAVYLSILIVFALTAFIFKYYKRRDLLFGFLFYLLLMALPILNMLYVRGRGIEDSKVLFYEHYTYLPSIGLYFIVALWVQKRQALGIVLIAYLLLMSALSFNRCAIWRNPITLWSDAIAQSQQNPVPVYALAYVNRGNAYQTQGRGDLAALDYQKAIVLNPKEAQAYANLGVIHAEQGNFSKALSYLNKAISLDSTFTNAYYNRNLIYAQMNGKH